MLFFPSGNPSFWRGVIPPLSPEPQSFASSANLRETDDFFFFFFCIFFGSRLFSLWYSATFRLVGIWSPPIDPLESSWVPFLPRDGPSPTQPEAVLLPSGGGFLYDFPFSTTEKTFLFPSLRQSFSGPTERLRWERFFFPPLSPPKRKNLHPFLLWKGGSTPLPDRLYRKEPFFFLPLFFFPSHGERRRRASSPSLPCQVVPSFFPSIYMKVKRVGKGGLGCFGGEKTCRVCSPPPFKRDLFPLPCIREDDSFSYRSLASPLHKEKPPFEKKNPLSLGENSISCFLFPPL